MKGVLSQSVETFFGLNSDYMTKVYQMFFDLMQVGNWSFQNIYIIPISLRNWFYQKLSDYVTAQNKRQ